MPWGVALLAQGSDEEWSGLVMMQRLTRFKASSRGRVAQAHRVCGMRRLRLVAEGLRPQRRNGDLSWSIRHHFENTWNEMEWNGMKGLWFRCCSEDAPSKNMSNVFQAKDQLQPGYQGLRTVRRREGCPEGVATN